MDLNDYDSILTSLATVLTHQDTINQPLLLTTRRLEETSHDIKVLLQQQQAVKTQQALVNTQHTTLSMRIARTLDRIDEQLDRIFPDPATR